MLQRIGAAESVADGDESEVKAPFQHRELKGGERFEKFGFPQPFAAGARPVRFDDEAFAAVKGETVQAIAVVGFGFFRKFLIGHDCSAVLY